MIFVLRRLSAVLGGAVRAVLSFGFSTKIQCGLVIANIFLLRRGQRAHQRARFAASVRVVRDLRSEDDIRYLLGRLPPWITAPEWERGDTVQVLLGLLWPAINSTVCAILKRELEERVQESSDFGHIAFSRLSFGKHPPVVVGIKAVPLHGEDLLAMVVDVDVRWAGEPDVVLHLTKLGGASLGLSGVQLASVVRLVFSPITEDPPFLRRMSVSFLQRPYVDFSVRALGGPDLMSLPAISTWLRTVVLNLAEKAIVWPKEVSVPLVPPREEHEDGEAAPVVVHPPLGVLVVRVIAANIQPRRSTFLGRLKLPSPRMSMLLPPLPQSPSSGVPTAAEVEGGVTQAALTGVQEKTRDPFWQQEFAFVVTHGSQTLRLLLSHKRMELLGADMPLGMAEIPMEDVIADAEFMAAAVGAIAAVTAMTDEIEGTAVHQKASSPPQRPAADDRSHTQGLTPISSPAPMLRLPPTRLSRASSSLARTPRQLESSKSSGWDDGYVSASSTPRGNLSSSGSITSVAWASPAASLLPEPPHAAPIRARSLNWTKLVDAMADLADASPPALPSVAGPRPDHAIHSQGLGLLLAASREVSTTPREPLLSQEPGLSSSHWTPRLDAEWPPSHSLSQARAGSMPAAQRTRGPGWLAPDGVWVQLPVAASVTMSGMVSSALASNAPAPHWSQGGSGVDEHRSWFRSLQTLVLGTNHDDEDHSDDEGSGGLVGSIAGRVRLSLQWLPVSEIGASLHAAGSSLSIAAEEKGGKLNGNGRGIDDEESSQHGGDKRKKGGKKPEKGRKSLESNRRAGQQSPAPSDGGSLGGPNHRASSETAATPTGPSASPQSAPALGATAVPASGVLAVRVSYTKLDYGDSPINPILALSVTGIPPALQIQGKYAPSNSIIPTGDGVHPQRLVSMDAQAGGRPGLLHWGRVFHLPVWNATSARARLELGAAASTLKLSSYGAELYALDACLDFDADVNVEAAAWIPLRDVVARGVVRGTWRLREARVGPGVAVAEEERLDVGRAAVVMAWFPLGAGVGACMER